MESLSFRHNLTVVISLVLAGISVFASACSPIIKATEAVSSVVGESSPAASLVPGESFASETILPVSNCVKENQLMWPLVTRLEEYKGYTGTDLATPKGTKIVAADDGIVGEAKNEPDEEYGEYIIIDHGNAVQTLYAHCSKLYVSEGETVKKGDIIALSGNTGNAGDDALHFELRINGECVDPEPYLIKP